MAFLLVFVALGFIFCTDEVKANACGNAETATQDANDITDTDTGINLSFLHKRPVVALLWVASVIIAYLAGEFSLIPKSIDFLQEQLQKLKKDKAKTEATKKPETNENNFATPVTEVP